MFFFHLLTLIRMVISSFVCKTFLSVNAKNLILSKASDAFDINSRKKISLFLYNELIINFIIRLTSATNCCFSAFSRNSFNCATFKPSSLICSSSRLTTSSSVREPSLLLPISLSTLPTSPSTISSSTSSSALV